MKKQFLLLTVLLFLLGACAPKPAEHSFIKVNADGQFVRDGKPYYLVPISGTVPFLVPKVKAAIVNGCIRSWTF